MGCRSGSAHMEGVAPEALVADVEAVAGWPEAGLKEGSRTAEACTMAG